MSTDTTTGRTTLRAPCQVEGDLDHHINPARRLVRPALRTEISLALLQRRTSGEPLHRALRRALAAWISARRPAPASDDLPDTQFPETLCLTPAQLLPASTCPPRCQGACQQGRWSCPMPTVCAGPTRTPYTPAPLADTRTGLALRVAGAVMVCWFMGLLVLLFSATSWS